MELIFRICLFIAAIINFTPSLIIFLPNKIKDSYGVDVIDSNYELLLRHRAVLFGIVGGIMIFSAITKKHYELATSIGFISMLSFIILAQLVDGNINPEMRRVLNIDIVGLIILLLGFGLYKFS